MLIRLILRDTWRGWTGGAWLPAIFLLLVATLFPFVVGPDPLVLARLGGGIVWLGAVLAMLLPIDRMIAPDAQAGVLDALRLGGLSLELIMVAKWLATLLALLPVLLIASIPSAALLGLAPAQVPPIALALIIGLPGLAALSLLVGSLTAGFARAHALNGLLLLPLATPLIIFGAALIGGEPQALLLLAATSLLLSAVMPFAAAAAVRALDS